MTGRRGEDENEINESEKGREWNRDEQGKRYGDRELDEEKGRE